MQGFFWCAFGILFIIASIVGLLTIFSWIFDKINTKKRLKELKETSSKDDKGIKPKTDKGDK